MLNRIAVVAAIVGSAAIAPAQLNLMPVHDAPRWKVVAGVPEAPGAAVAVSSLATNQVVGQIRPDEKFMSFGTDGQVITLAFNGTIGYIPVSAARDLYPIEERAVEWRAWGKTLQQQAEEEKAKEKDISDRTLKPREKKPKTGAAGGAGGAPGAGMDQGGSNAAGMEGDVK